MKINNLALQKTLLRKWKEKLYSERRYLRNTCPTACIRSILRILKTQQKQNKQPNFKNVQNIFHYRGYMKASKHVKRCQSLTIKKIKKITRHHYVLIKMAKIKNTDNPKCWWGSVASGMLLHCWCELKKWYRHSRKSFGSFLQSQIDTYRVSQFIWLLSIYLEKWNLMCTQKPVHDCL